MIESFVGISIALAASISLLTTIAVSKNAIKNSGVYPLTRDEISTVRNAGYSDDEIKALDIYIRKLNLDY